MASPLEAIITWKRKKSIQMGQQKSSERYLILLYDAHTLNDLSEQISVVYQFQKGMLERSKKE